MAERRSRNNTLNILYCTTGTNIQIVRWYQNVVWCQCSSKKLSRVKSFLSHPSLINWFKLFYMRQSEKKSSETQETTCDDGLIGLSGVSCICWNLRHLIGHRVTFIGGSSFRSPSVWTGSSWHRRGSGSRRSQLRFFWLDSSVPDTPPSVRAKDLALLLLQQRFQQLFLLLARKIWFIIQVRFLLSNSWQNMCTAL